MVKSSYIYLSIRLNNNEYDKYLNDIINTLENNNYIKNNNIYIKDNLNIMINKYDKHPYDEIIDNYKKNYINHKDYIIILRGSAEDKLYKELEEDYISLINSIGKETYNESKTKK